MDKKALKEELKNNIIEALNLQGVQPQDIDDNAKLFDSDGLGLDSVDALELIVMVESKYAVSVDDKDEAKEIFTTLDALADYILLHKK